MALVDGDPAATWDVWTRVITSDDYWTKDGKLHNRAFSGRAFAPPDGSRAWTVELSGRLLSIIGDLESESRDFCANLGRNFSGIMFEHVGNLRGEVGGFPVDVIYTPFEEVGGNGDKAHADFVIFRATDKADITAVRDWLQDLVRCVKPEQLATVRALREEMPIE
jgi:hypothetical protein